ncbi:MAG TPA: glycosyltransferase family A protein [Solirubrobacterales bacterium]|nr:glycosyltransferase family A protein [Solirubrobacterales bacterium]
MGQLLEVLSVEVDEDVVEASLLGGNVDSPQPGRRMAASGLEIGGWALGPSGRPEAIEASLEGRVLAEGAWQHRGDLASAFPDQEEASESGFEIVVDAGRFPAEAEIEVSARLDGTAVAFGRLRLRRYWRGASGPEETPLVSIVVVDGSGDAEAVARTLPAIGAQRHPATEVLVLRPSTAASGPADWEAAGIREVAAGLNGPTLRNEGIRQSNGELILFLPGGSRLTPDALALGVEMLARKPSVPGVIDGDRGGVAAALYRRSAFEELEGFVDGGSDCDLELAIRAQRFEALVTPGAFVAGEG